MIFPLIFCLFSCLLYTQTSSHQDIDSKAYLSKGYLFYKTDKFAEPGEQQPYYALGYPFVIGLLYKLFTPDLRVIILFQLLLSLLSCLLIMRIARHFFGSRAGPIAGAFFSFNLGYLVFTQFVLTEIVLSFLLLLFFERLIRGSLVLSALALGTSIIIKPAALYFIFFICPFLFIFTKKIKYPLLFALCFYLPVLGYMSYNKVMFNNFSIGSLDKVNFYYWYFAHVRAYEHGTNADIERTKLMQLQEHEVTNLFWQELRQKPLLFARIWLTNVFKTFVGLYTTNLKLLVEPNVHGGQISFFKMQGNWLHKAYAYITAGATKQWVIIVGFLEAGWSLLRYLLCLLGLWFLLRRKEWGLLILSLIFLAYFALITGHDGCARFRMMFEWLTLVLAAGGLSSLLSIHRGFVNQH